jgi:hypothetical protein
VQQVKDPFVIPTLSLCESQDLLAAVPELVVEWLRLIRSELDGYPPVVVEMLPQAGFSNIRILLARICEKISPFFQHLTRELAQITPHLSEVFNAAEFSLLVRQ